MPEVVTRFAPSPTGNLHIGGARTAIFSWALARRHGGRFLLRFEDTDRGRSSKESEVAQLEALRWIGLEWDAAPGFDHIPRQSERMGRYAEAVDILLASGAAYRCICTPDAVEAMRERARAAGDNPGYDGTCREAAIGPDPGKPFCIRIRVPDESGITRWNDLCAGPSGQETSEMDDFVAVRTDGTPIYHLAVVVDDHDMGVTHVMRGREHMTSTPRQLLLYAGLGWPPPQFAHLPLLVSPSGKKLSKREGDVSVQGYRDRGFPREAVFNYLSRLGWGQGDLEIFSSDDLVRLFDLEGVGRSEAQVHDDKLLWLSAHYLKTLPLERLIEELPPFFEAVAGRAVEIDAGLRGLIELLRERADTLAEMGQKAAFYFADITYEPKAARKFLRPETAEPLGALRDALATLEPWSDEALEAAFHSVVEPRDLKLGKLAQPVRVALTGTSASPGIYETLRVVGRDLALARIDAALAHIAALPD